MDLVPPGGTARHIYPNDHRAATLWYHDHAMDQTGHNNFMGLGGGLYIIQDDAETNLQLPGGAYDVPLIIQGRTFTPDGSFVFDDANKFGAASDVTLVNGAPWPRMEVARRKYRFRILNAANAEFYALALDSGRPLVQIATDGGLLPAPVRSDSIILSMAERIEIVMDFADYPLGATVVLQNRWPEGAGDIMRFDVVRDAKDDSILPDTLSTIDALPESHAVRTRTFDIGPILAASFPPVTFSINGMSFDPDRVDAAPRLDDVEIWRFRTGGVVRHHHPMHIHLVNFQILDRNGAPPAPYEAGWKDTVRVGPHDDVRVIARFSGYRGKYLLHCHNLAHEDHAMMARFDVV
jgi:FtsP/CotA-like multicopper oxidase with cupredoxin domain